MKFVNMVIVSNTGITPVPPTVSANAVTTGMHYTLLRHI